jgi:hypothetical protein
VLPPGEFTLKPGRPEAHPLGQLRKGKKVMEAFQLGMLISTLIEAMAASAEIEAMKAANQARESRGEAQAYPDEAFKDKADYLYGLSVQAQSHEVLNSAYAAHPERFVRKPPVALPLPEAVWINPPPKEVLTEQLLQ